MGIARAGLGPALARFGAWLSLLGFVLLPGCASLPAVQASHEAIAALPVDESQARQAISAYRRAHGLGDVSVDPALEAVAQRQAEAMAGANELSHTVAGTLPRRLAQEGADRSAAVENVSAGYGSLEAALGGWRRSPPHNANLLFGPLRRMGIAAASAPNTRYKTFWSLVMTN